MGVVVMEYLHISGFLCSEGRQRVIPCINPKPPKGREGDRLIA